MLAGYGLSRCKATGHGRQGDDALTPLVDFLYPVDLDGLESAVAYLVPITHGVYCAPMSG